eukprot:GFUD01026936.1.p1 GENE.GFUD01026936.1~~GFUD01026936.1.p1  ORF type:complete len:286 (+),score=91.58 GFUD01026936.1:210-1067(+)
MFILTGLFIFSIVTLVNADVDAEDLIARGYTCSLAAKDAEFGPADVGAEIVCDDGVCIECVQTAKKAKSILTEHDDVEDYLKAGYVCSPASSTLEGRMVCDDGVCYKCKKPVWLGKSGDVEDYLERGHSCFLVNDVPKDALNANVVVICDDGDCFGCIEADDYSEPPLQAKSLDVEEYAVTKHFLDEAEDFLEDGYKCGLSVQPVNNRSGKEKVVCEGQLCLVCDVQSKTRREQVVTLSQVVVEMAEDLVDIGFSCVAVLEKVKIKNSVTMKTVCDKEMCFICRN